MNKAITKRMGVVWLVALGLLLVVLLAMLAVTEVPEAEAPADERERRAGYQAQERYYEALDLYGDVEGAVEAARIVFEREIHKAAEDPG